MAARRSALKLLLLFSLLLTGICLYLKLQSEIKSLEGYSPEQSSSVLPGPANIDSVGSDLAPVTYLKYLNNYCHRSLLDVNASLRASFEGKLSTNSKDFELLHVHVVARHGDRTPVNVHHIGSPVLYQCGLVDGEVNWSGLNDFPQPSTLPHSTAIRHIGIKLHPGPVHSCGVGQLTSAGFLQQYSLGLLMKTLYKDYNTNGLSSAEDISNDLFVQSTDFPRTIHSAAAFLLGFLPDDPRVRRATDIRVSGDQGTLFLDSPPPGVHRSYKHCKKFMKIWHSCLEKINYFSTRDQLFKEPFHRFCSMFELECHRESYVTGFFDLVLSRGCHDRKSPLPCNGKGECIDLEFASQLSSFSDWTWNHRHTVNASIVAIMPFLKHSVLDVMKNVIHKSEKGGTASKIMLSFAHDATLIRILKALQVTTAVGWMPYASRLVFELWRRKDTRIVYVRILFNGSPITHTMNLPVTVERTERQDFVEFSSWRDSLVTGDYRSLESYNSVCGI